MNLLSISLKRELKCFKYLLVNGYNMKGLIRMIFIFFNLFQLLILEDVLWFLGIVLMQCNLDLWFVKKVFQKLKRLVGFFVICIEI